MTVPVTREAVSLHQPVVGSLEVVKVKRFEEGVPASCFEIMVSVSVPQCAVDPQREGYRLLKFG